MAKHKLSWDEMRPHMIAGLFWWLAAFLTLEVLHKTYDYLCKNLGGTTAILIDLAAIAVIFFVLLTLIRWWIGPKNAKKLSKVAVHPENTDYEDVSYKNKVRIAIKNNTPEELHIQNLVWIANGVVSLELPPRMKMQLEKFKDSGSRDQWNPDEVVELHVPSGFTFPTWIALHDKLNEKDFGRIQQNDQFGTLLVTVDGDDLHIPV